MPVILPALVGALVVALALTVTLSDARFAASTSNADNRINAGRVDIELVHTTPLFDAVDLARGQSAESCVELEYVGDITPADVTVAFTSSGNAPRGVSVELATGASCSDATATVVHTGSLVALLADDSSTGLAVWSPRATGERVAVLTSLSASPWASEGSVDVVAEWRARPGGGS